VTWLWVGVVFALLYCAKRWTRRQQDRRLAVPLGDNGRPGRRHSLGDFDRRGLARRKRANYWPRSPPTDSSPTPTRLPVTASKPAEPSMGKLRRAWKPGWQRRPGLPTAARTGWDAPHLA
jgi:hypothetical protein